MLVPKLEGSPKDKAIWRWDLAQLRRRAAYHEAGHVVIGYYFDWGLDERGVSLRGEGGDCCGAHRMYLGRSEVVCLCVLLAGWLAETTFFPAVARRRSDAELGEAMDQGNFDAPEHDEYQGDDYIALSSIGLDQSFIPVAEGFARYRHYESLTLAMLQSPGISTVVTRVAERLLAMRKMTDAEARSLLGPNFPSYYR